MKNNCNLRNKVLLLLLLAVAGVAKAQTHEFAPVGAEWYYERLYLEGWTYSGVAYDRFRSLRTVEISGWECKEIELFQNLDCHGEVNPYTEIRYITQEGDQVFEVEDGQRFLLYDFGKGVGEWWYAPKYDDTITVVDVSYITLNDGSVRKRMETHLSNMDWYIYNIIEGVGMDYTLFPYFYTDGAFCLHGPLRCYSEECVPLIQWGETECDYEVLGVEENALQINVYPNPAKDRVVIEGIEAAEVNVYNALGQVVKTVRGTNEIDLSGLVEGVYMLRITDAEGKSHAVRVVVK